jgi:hypothetical protein
LNATALFESGKFGKAAGALGYGPGIVHAGTRMNISG